MRPGSKIKYTHPYWGMCADIKKAKAMLEEGKEYTVKQMEVGDWFSRVWLEELPNEAFNTVHFESV